MKCLLSFCIMFLFTADLFTAKVAYGAQSPYRQGIEKRFQNWMTSKLWQQAKKGGISRRVFSRATRPLTLNWKLPDLRPPGSPAKAPHKYDQSEFSSPERYFSQNNINSLVAMSRKRLSKWGAVLKRIERRYGVPAKILVAIWGRESAFGNARLPHNAIRILATQAFMGRRKAYFNNELLAALKILQQGHIGFAKMQSSWAGALGQPQFLPSKFLEFAVDFDGDGRRDIWNSVPDTLASIANYLGRNGWRKGRDWGFEADIPAGVSCALEGPDKGMKVKAWVARGVRRVKGRRFPASEMRKTAYLLMPAGRFGPAFIATPNFYTLKTYNESDLYALFIGHLADRMGRNTAFVRKWAKFSGFSRRDVQKMQKRLEKKGYDVGGADGLVGFKTRTALGKWQERAGKKATCFPDARLIRQIR